MLLPGRRLCQMVDCVRLEGSRPSSVEDDGIKVSGCAKAITRGLTDSKLLVIACRNHDD